MTTARRVRLVILLAGLAAAGCVERRFVIESNVPNAQVFIDNKQVGAAPAYSQFEYYGYYNITLVHPGYQTVTKRVHVAAPWYAYPPIDFLAEVLWPFHVEDVRRHHIVMEPAPQTRLDDLIGAADALRQRGWSLPSPTPQNTLPQGGPPIIEAPVNPGVPTVPPNTLPAVPPPSTVIPSVTPAQYRCPNDGTFLR
jgi:hypothetical protein